MAFEHKQTMKKYHLAFAAIIALSLPAFAQEKQPAAPVPAPDDSAVNERDRSGETKTPMDQSNSPEDLKITQAIRQAIMKDESLSMTAKNVKIITADGRVTLRGPVNSGEEKASIEKLAKATAGEKNVENQLEVKAVEQPKK